MKKRIKRPTLFLFFSLVCSAVILLVIIYESVSMYNISHSSVGRLEFELNSLSPCNCESLCYPNDKAIRRALEVKFPKLSENKKAIISDIIIPEDKNNRITLNTYYNAQDLRKRIRKAGFKNKNDVNVFLRRVKYNPESEYDSPVDLFEYKEGNSTALTLFALFLLSIETQYPDDDISSYQYIPAAKSNSHQAYIEIRFKNGITKYYNPEVDYMVNFDVDKIRNLTKM